MITKNLRKVPAVKKYQTFDILIIYFHNEAKVFLNLKVGNSELESGKLICSRTLYGIGGDQEKLAEVSSCEKINMYPYYLHNGAGQRHWPLSDHYNHLL